MSRPIERLIIAALFAASCASEYRPQGGDVTPPAVKSTSPSNGAVDVPVDAVVSVVFSEQMDESSLNASNFRLLDDDGGEAAGRIEYSRETVTATFKPEKKVREGTLYTVLLTRSVKDKAGLSLSSMTAGGKGGEDVVENFSFIFTTVKIPPVVHGTVPENGAVDVDTAAFVTVTFSEPMAAGTISRSTFYVEGENGEVSYDEASSTATFAPDEPLAEGKTFSAVLSTAITDASGIPIPEEFRFRFMTKAVPPVVVSTVPEDGALGVPFALAEVKAVFSEDMNPGDVTPNTVVLSGRLSGRVSGVVSWLPAETAVVFKPDRELREGETYFFSISRSVRDASGVRMAKDFQSGFSVRAVPPSVFGSDPADGSAGVPVSLAEVAVFFSEAMDPESFVTESRYEVPPVTVSMEPATAFGVSYEDTEDGRHVMTMTLQGGLVSNTPYSVKIGGEVTDAHGIEMAADFLFSFTTSAAEDNNPPTRITDLVFSQIDRNEGMLAWTAPGDDSVAGVPTGRVTAYDIRSSAQPINQLNFDQADKIDLQVEPSDPGERQELRLSDFFLNAVHYFAIRAVDDVGLASYSNAASGKITPGRDRYSAAGADSWTGYSLAGVDADADGAADFLAVGAPLRSSSGGVEIAGAVLIFDLDAADPMAGPVSIIEGTEAGAELGYTLASADFDGDGKGDLAAGAPGAAAGGAGRGTVYVFHGTEDGFAADSSAQADVEIRGWEDFGGFSSALATGRLDSSTDVYLAVGSPAGGSGAGRISIFKKPFSERVNIDGDEQGAELGAAIAAGADLNGDGKGDLVAGAPLSDSSGTDSGEILVFLGSDDPADLAVADFRVSGEYAGDLFGFSVALADGGVTPSGIVVGAPRTACGGHLTGAVYFFSSDSQIPAGAGSATEKIEGWTDSGLFGASLAFGGDVFGKGLSDLIVGEPGGASLSGAQTGCLHIFSGSGDPLPLFNYAGMFWGDDNYDSFGHAAVFLGNVDRDAAGFDDFAASAPYSDRLAQDAGAVYLFR